ncbi:MAG: AIR synthase related protein, partial [Longimicrobiales bacterium]|nr:AIR synthase related protein [Longimicrobiales bacterium]
MKKVSLELGSGGRLMRDFIAGTILPSFGNPVLDELSDASHLPGGIAFTTDSYVVDPLFFPGGDIGRLAVNGTVNDLVVAGAEPRFLSLAFILEEGLDLDVLERVIRSIRAAARAANVCVVTGDTKVVRRGQGDKIYINTAGIGRSIARPRVRKIRPGDKVILTGTLGDHSLAVMLARGDFGLSSSVRSDCA